MAYGSLSDVKAAVMRAGGVLTVSMLELRDAYGAGKLGVNVRGEISSELQRLGVRHQPRPLPQYQEEQVRLYLGKAPVAKLLRAARKLGAEYDRVLRETANGEAQRKLQEIRKLLRE